MFRSLSKAAVFCVGVVLLGLTIVRSAAAATSWSQSNWAGGSGQTAWAASDAFLSSSSIDFSTANQLTLSSSAPSDWLGSGWQYRKELTTDADQIGGSDPLSTFPLLVSFSSDSDLASYAQSGGEDLRFTSADGVTQLNFEIESFDHSTGALKAWVSVPSLSATTDTSLYMYYGNPDGSLTANHNPESVWSNYNLVLHMNQPSGQFLDSTSNSNDTTTAIVASRSAGKINGAIETTAATGELVIPDNPNDSLDMTTDFTISFWVKPNTGGGAFQQVIQKTVDGGDPNNLGIYLNNTDVFISYYDDGFHQYQGFSAITYDQWNLVTYRRTGDFGAGTLYQYIYVNGALVRTDKINSSNELLIPNSSNLLLVRQPSGYPLDGALDEVRISRDPFSPEYLAAEYQNQNAPGSFVSVAAPEEYPPVYAASGTLTSSIFDTTQSSNWGIVTVTSTTPASTTVQVKARSGSDANVTDSPDFTSCSALTSGSDLSTSDCIDDGDRYIQYQVILESSDNTKTPVLESVTIAYTEVPPAPSTSTSSAPAAFSPALPPTCGASVPVGQPDLFQIDREGTVARLYFTPVNDYTAAYHVVYGFTAGDQRFGSLSEHVTAQTNNGVQVLTIRDLDPNAKYWFQIAAVNDCAVGSWSNWLQADRLRGQRLSFFRYWQGL
jgi:hypothetical protein